MNKELENLQQDFIQQYYLKTGININNINKISDKLREDISNYLVDTIYINAGILVFDYFFDIETIKQLTTLYFKKISLNEIQAIIDELDNFTSKHRDILPDFNDNIFCAISDEIAFDIVNFLDAIKF